MEVTKKQDIWANSIPLNSKGVFITINNQYWLGGDNMDKDNMIKHKDIKTIEDYKLYKKQQNKKYYEQHKQEIRDRQKAYYYSKKKRGE